MRIATLGHPRVLRRCGRGWFLRCVVNIFAWGGAEGGV